MEAGPHSETQNLKLIFIFLNPFALIFLAFRLGTPCSRHPAAVILPAPLDTTRFASSSLRFPCSSPARVRYTRQY